jgi:hypothetical protein
MRILLKILLLPISLVLSLVVNLSAFLVGVIGGLLNIISTLLIIGAVLMFGSVIFGSSSYVNWQPAIILTVVAFIISPYGLPKIAAWLVIKIDDLNDFIKGI